MKLRYALGGTSIAIGLIMHIVIGVHKFQFDIGDRAYFVVYWPWWLIGMGLVIVGAFIAEVYKR